MNNAHARFLPAAAAILLAGGLSMWSPLSHATGATVVVKCWVAPGIPCASSFDVNGTTTAVTAVGTQLTTTHTYLATGMGGGPGGAIALLGGINERLGMVTNANDEAIENDDLAARQRIYDERMMDVRGSRIPKPSRVLRACVQATAATGRAGAARTSGGAGGAANKEVAERYTDDRPQIQSLIDVVAERGELGVCSATDVAQKRPGCHDAGAGDRPSADLRLTSLFDGGKAEPPANLSLDEKGFEIGKQLIVNITPVKPPELPNDEQRESQGGVMYMINYNRYAGRASAAVAALTEILGFGVAMGTEGSAVNDSGAEAFTQTWGSKKTEYEEIFGSGTFPAKPSERELLRFDVFKHYASVQKEKEEAGLSAEEVALAQLEVAAVNARVNYAILERLEKQNVLLSVLVSQQMDPLTAAGMESQISKLGGQTREGD